MKGGQGSDRYRMPTQDAYFLVTRAKQAASKQCRLNPEIGAIWAAFDGHLPDTGGAEDWVIRLIPEVAIAREESFSG